MRDAAAGAQRPVMLYSIGKDSSVLLHLARKAFYPAPPPFPLLHVDTTWKFRDMYAFRAAAVAQAGVELIVHTNQEGLAAGVTPFTHGSMLYTDIMKTEALRQALDQHAFDLAFGGARRDEESSRAKERVFSLRTARHGWDPKRQRPELWSLYNGAVRPGEHVRVFPLSNWTELDVWEYVAVEDLELPPLYFAHRRQVFSRDGMLYAASPFVELLPGEQVSEESVRFRTVGDMTCTGAVRSTAVALGEVIAEIASTRVTERGETRADDRFTDAAMEDRKREGYF
jgi:sulfate adenylyltransferase subunit 2